MLGLSNSSSVYNDMRASILARMSPEVYEAYVSEEARVHTEKVRLATTIRYFALIVVFISFVFSYNFYIPLFLSL